MTNPAPVRWGILDTANIARSSFLPGLRAAGGEAGAVASRDLQRARAYATANDIPRPLGSYQSLVEDPKIDAVYIALPNSLHAEWTKTALQHGKTVLCEKPLCLTVEETAEVLEVARQSEGYLWEAFVFPFRAQSHRIHQIISSGQIGEVREIHSGFHFRMRNRQNIRLDPAMGGGSLLDVGCYPIHLADQMFGAIPSGAVAMARWAPEGVDEEMQAILGYPGSHRLLMSCGFLRSQDTFSRIIGSEGEIRLTNPFHPGENDTLQLRTSDGIETEHADAGPSFTWAIRHINAVIQGREEPRHLAVDDSMGTAIAMELCDRAARGHEEERIEIT